MKSAGRGGKADKVVQGYVRAMRRVNKEINAMIVSSSSFPTSTTRGP